MKKIVTLLLVCMMVCVVPTWAQDSIPVIQNPFVNFDVRNVPFDKIIGLENAIYSALLLLFSYLSFAIPGIKNIPIKAVRVFVIGTVLAFFYFGYRAAVGTFEPAAFVTVIINYLVATNIYDKILRPVVAITPK